MPGDDDAQARGSRAVSDMVATGSSGRDDVVKPHPREGGAIPRPSGGGETVPQSTLSEAVSRGGPTPPIALPVTDAARDAGGAPRPSVGEGTVGRARLYAYYSPFIPAAAKLHGAWKFRAGCWLYRFLLNKL